MSCVNARGIILFLWSMGVSVVVYVGGDGGDDLGWGGGEGGGQPWVIKAGKKSRAFSTHF